MLLHCAAKTLHCFIAINYICHKEISLLFHIYKNTSRIYVNIENLSILLYIALYCLSALYRYIYSFFLVYVLVKYLFIALYSLMAHFYCLHVFICLIVNSKENRDKLTRAREMTTTYGNLLSDWNEAFPMLIVNLLMASQVSTGSYRYGRTLW